MWGLGRDCDGRPPSEDRADDKQGDLRWRLFRAAGELQDKAGCSPMLVPPLRTEPPPDPVQRNIFLTTYLRIHGAIPLDTFARCHFTQELYRMKWVWEARCSFEVDADDENPLPCYGNWETPDGKRFLCKWEDDCPPCEDSIRGPRSPGADNWDGQDGDGMGYPDDDDFAFYY